MLTTSKKNSKESPGGSKRFIYFFRPTNLVSSPGRVPSCCCWPWYWVADMVFGPRRSTVSFFLSSYCSAAMLVFRFFKILVRRRLATIRYRQYCAARYRRSPCICLLTHFLLRRVRVQPSASTGGASATSATTLPGTPPREAVVDNFGLLSGGEVQREVYFGLVLPQRATAERWARHQAPRYLIGTHRTMAVHTRPRIRTCLQGL